MEQKYRDYKIAFLGKTGIGKSSLINRLFGLNLPVDAVEECTRNAVATWVRNEDGRFRTPGDSVMVMDTPGISAALENDRFYLPFYHHVLMLADCVVWVVQGNTRADRADQEMLLCLKPYIRPETAVVLCVNMVDKIGEEYRRNWDEELNEPKAALQELISQRCGDLLRKFEEVGFVPDAVAACSAQKGYHMDELLEKIGKAGAELPAPTR